MRRRERLEVEPGEPAGGVVNAARRGAVGSGDQGGQAGRIVGGGDQRGLWGAERGRGAARVILVAELGAVRMGQAFAPAAGIIGISEDAVVPPRLIAVEASRPRLS